MLSLIDIGFFRVDEDEFCCVVGRWNENIIKSNFDWNFFILSFLWKKYLNDWFFENLYYFIEKLIRVRICEKIEL